MGKDFVLCLILLPLKRKAVLWYPALSDYSTNLTWIPLYIQDIDTPIRNVFEFLMQKEERVHPITSAYLWYRGISTDTSLCLSACHLCSSISARRLCSSAYCCSLSLRCLSSSSSWSSLSRSKCRAASSWILRSSWSLLLSSSSPSKCAASSLPPSPSGSSGVFASGLALQLDTDGARAGTDVVFKVRTVCSCSKEKNHIF